MLNRQRIILALLDRAGGEANRLSLMKWAFLLSKEGHSSKLESFYQFLPYKYGPYSFNLVHELDNMKRNGYVKDISDNQYNLSNISKKETSIINYTIKNDIEQLWKLYGRLSTTKLLDRVYKKYPWYSIKSQRSEKRHNDLIPTANINIYTAGYQGLQIDGFLDLLLESGIKRIIDIRNNPISRSFGFHKNTLARLSSFVDIDYYHYPKLGIQSSSRKDISSVEEYSNLLKTYRKDIQRNKQTEIDQVDKLMKEQPSVLLCQEEDPTFCHRSVLADVLSQRSSMNIVELRGHQ